MHRDLRVMRAGEAFIHSVNWREPSAPTVVVLGRNDFRRRSAMIDALIDHLVDCGVAVCWYEHRWQRHARLKEAAYYRICDAWLHALVLAHPRIGAWSRRAVQCWLRLRYGAAEKVAEQSPEAVHAAAATCLSDFINKHDLRQVFLVAHSAGGITAALVQAQTRVQKTVCFGYPFKHPDRDVEPYRTRPLRNIVTPYLIVQGEADRYGSPAAFPQYAASPAVELLSIQSDHDYQYACPATLSRVLSFLGIAPFQPQGTSTSYASSSQPDLPAVRGGQ